MRPAGNKSAPEPADPASEPDGPPPNSPASQTAGGPGGGPSILSWPAVAGGSGVGVGSALMTHSPWVAVVSTVVVFGIVPVVTLIAGTCERMHARTLEHQEKQKQADNTHLADLQRSQVIQHAAALESQLQRELIAKAAADAAMTDLPSALRAVLADRAHPRDREIVSSPPGAPDSSPAPQPSASRIFGTEGPYGPSQIPPV